MSRLKVVKIWKRFKEQLERSDVESVPNEQWSLQNRVLRALEEAGDEVRTFNNSDKKQVSIALFSSQQVALLIADVGRRPGDDKSLRGDAFTLFINSHQAVKALRAFFKDPASVGMTAMLFVSGESGNTRQPTKGMWTRDSHTGVLAVWKDQIGGYCFRQFDPNPGSDAVLLAMSKDIVQHLSPSTVLVPVTDGDNCGRGECFRISMSFIFDCIKGETGPRGGDVARIFNMKTKKYL